MSSILSASLPAGTGNAALDEYTKAGLNAVNGGVDYTQTPTYQSLMSLLGPGKDGGLNPNLAAQYSSGSQIIGQQTGANKASAMSSAQGRGLGQSSIAAQGVENAELGGQMAESSLLGSLYGQQNQNTQQLAGYLSSGSQSQLHDLLGIYDSAGTSAANMAMYSQGLQEALQAAMYSANAQQTAGMYAGAGSAISGIAQGAATYAAFA